MMLYTMHYFMGRLLTITNGSGREAFDGLRSPPLLDYDFRLTSKLLNRQLKSAMYLLMQETTREVLGGLEKLLKRRTKASWAPCFCTLLILCICAEELQVAVDGFALHKITRNDKTNFISREDGVETSRKLDDLLYGDCKTLFHGIYKSHKPKQGQRAEQLFNPIRDGMKVDGEEGMTPAMNDLVEDIVKVLDIHGKGPHTCKAVTRTLG